MNLKIFSFVILALLVPGPPVQAQEIEMRNLFMSQKISEKRLVLQHSPNGIRHGKATWYSKKDRHVRRHTANGEVFDDSKKTCAAWGIPFGTHLKVTNLENKKSVVCRVNDRGPAKRLGRQIDLSKTAFREIASLKKGVVKVSAVPVNKNALKRKKKS